MSDDSETTTTQVTGRFPLLPPGKLSAQQRAVYDAIAGPPRGNDLFTIVQEDGTLAGPFNAMLLSPSIGGAAQSLGAALRFTGQLSGRLRELVICAVAAELKSAYEWYAHSSVAVTVGVDHAELEHLKEGRVPPTLSAAERAALDFARVLLQETNVSDAIYAQVHGYYGHPGIVELTLLVGYYRMLSSLLAAGNIPSPEPGPTTYDPHSKSTAQESTTQKEKP